MNGKETPASGELITSKRSIQDCCF